MIEDLKRSDFFAGFDDQALAHIAAFARKATFEAGRIVFDRDEEAHTVWMMLSGRIRQGFEVSPGTEVWFQTAVTVFGAGLDAKSGWGTQVVSHWFFGSQPNHYLCGSDGPVSTAHRIYAGLQQ